MIAGKKSVILTTAYLAVYIVLINTGISALLLAVLCTGWPFIFIWMIYCILKDDRCDYPELKDSQEWGYKDENREELGVF
jgi:hypothetical protein